VYQLPRHVCHLFVAANIAALPRQQVVSNRLVEALLDAVYYNKHGETHYIFYIAHSTAVKISSGLQKATDKFRFVMLIPSAELYNTVNYTGADRNDELNPNILPVYLTTRLITWLTLLYLSYFNKLTADHS